MEAAQKGKVLITGVTGFIGSHVCLQFLSADKFTVRGTVRSLKNAKKINPIRSAFGEEKFAQLELVEADLKAPESLDKAVEGCDFVVHVASPFPASQPWSEKNVIKPAVDGTIAILNACVKHGIKKLVVTSSAHAVYASGVEEGF